MVQNYFQISSAPASSDESVWSFFAEFTEASVPPEEIATRLQSQPELIEVKYEVSKDGLLIDGFHFPLRYAHDSAIMMRSGTAAAALARINEILGYGHLASVILYEMGEAAGKRTYEAVVNIVGKEMLEQNLPYILQLYSAVGWGIFQFQAFHRETKTATIRVFNNFECGSHNKAPIATGNFIRGHLAGWLGQMFGNNVQVTETSCIAKGDKFCEFQVEP